MRLTSTTRHSSRRARASRRVAHRQEDTRLAAREVRSSHALAEEQVLQAAGDAIAPEGAAQQAESPQRKVACAWLFQPDNTPREVRLDEIPDLIAVDQNLVWIDLAAYDEEVLQQVASLVGLRDRTVRGFLSPWQHPRVRTVEGSFWVSLTVAELQSDALRTIARQLDVVVRQNLLVTAHKGALPFYDHVLDRASTDPDLVRLDSAFLLYIVLDELLEYYEALDAHMQGQIEQMQMRALQDSSDDFLEELLTFKSYAFGVAQLAQQHQRVFKAFLRPDFPFLEGDEMSGHFRDLDERLTRRLDRLEGTRQESNNTFDIYLSHQSHRTNDVVKTFTVVATILFSATFIEGIFSPSFQGVPIHNIPGFAVMLGLIAAVATATVLIFRRRDWL